MKSTFFARKLRNNSTDVEKILWNRLRSRNLLGYKFKRQAPIDSYIVDFVCFEKRLVIELDGGQHNSQKKKDKKRDEFLKKEGFQVIRFWNNEIIHNLDGVLEKIRMTLTPTLSRNGRGSTVEDLSL